MKILLITTLVALASGDVSHILNNPVYQYQAPINSYGAPSASVLGHLGVSSESVAYSNAGSVSVPQLTLPSASGPSVQFNSGYPGPSSVSGATIQTYDNGGFSTPVPISGDALASLQVSTSAPNVDYSQFQVSTPSPIGSVPSLDVINQQQQQPSSSYQFLSKLSQPTVSSVEINHAQFGSDAALNSGFASGGQIQGFGGSFGTTQTQYNAGHAFAGETSGGSIDDAFGVSTHAEEHSEPEVTKHLYFFAAPEEEEDESEAKISLPPVAPKKTYKIIFIKAPTYRNQAAITIPAPPQNEEKTLVYVLVKKPEKNANVRFQQAAPTKPSKPEVFFIKYKTQKEAEAAVAEIQKKHGQVIADLPAGQSVDQFQVQPEVAIGGHGHNGGFDSAGAHSYVSSTPVSIGFQARFGEGVPAAQNSVSVQSEEVSTNDASASIGGPSGSVSFQPTGDASPSVGGTSGSVSFQPTGDASASIGSNSGSVNFQPNGDAGASFGGIAGSVNFQQDRLGEEEPQDDGSNRSGTVGAGFVSSAVPQINYNNHGENTVSHQEVDSSDSTNQEDNSVGQGSEDISSNLTHEEQQENVSSVDREGQGSQSTGFQTYGPPNA